MLADLYPDSLHVREIGLRDSTDTSIWNYAKLNGFVIVSKDADFQHRSLLFGHPPKFIWLRVGNCPVKIIENVLRNQSIVIHTFEQDDTQAHLMLP